VTDFIIKVCGITTHEDAEASLDAGANALGFNFYARSPRYAAPEAAAKIAPSGSYLRVGVFVNASEAEIRSTARIANLDVVQIHGATAPVTGLINWQAIQVTTQPQSDEGIQAYLIDTFTPNFGGSGKTFDWSLAKNFPFRAIIAGGLDAANVAEAIRIAEPWGVDACSRLESQPGRKDLTLVAAFVNAALLAFQSKQAVERKGRGCAPPERKGTSQPFRRGA
jgi:phosphoribosylanthranilate isomerase